MADRTSAGIFGELFHKLAAASTGEPLDIPALSRWLWEQTRGYDFAHYQMYCDEALITLGLARRGIDPEYPEDGETILYGPVEDTPTGS